MYVPVPEARGLLFLAALYTFSSSPVAATPQQYRRANFLQTRAQLRRAAQTR